MGEYFNNKICQSMPLQEWLSLFKYFKLLAIFKMTVETDMLAILMHSDEQVTTTIETKYGPWYAPIQIGKVPRSSTGLATGMVSTGHLLVRSERRRGISFQRINLKSP